MKGINIFLADGFEDIEALAVNDVLRRGGLKVNLVSISDDPFVVSSHGVTIGAEQFFSDWDGSHAGTGARDFMIFPGGICAAPGLVLGQLDVPDGLEFTCFDGFQDALLAKGAHFHDVPAVSCGRIVTGRSAGNAVAFGLAILEHIRGKEEMQKVKMAMYPGDTGK